MSADVVIEATVIDFDESLWECVATMDGNKIRIDPFVTAIWEWESRNNLLGTWKFEGFWCEAGSFLPNKIYQQRRKRDEPLRKPR